jgi:hypothetical protein
VLREGSLIKASLGRLERLFDWADVEGLDLQSAKLVANRPRRTFTYPDDNKQQLDETGLVGSVLLFVEPR